MQWVQMLRRPHRQALAQLNRPQIRDLQGCVVLKLAQKMVIAVVNAQGPEDLVADRAGEASGDPDPRRVRLAAALASSLANPPLNLSELSLGKALLVLVACHATRPVEQPVLVQVLSRRAAFCVVCLFPVLCHTVPPPNARAFGLLLDACNDTCRCTTWGHRERACWPSRNFWRRGSYRSAIS